MEHKKSQCWPDGKYILDTSQAISDNREQINLKLIRLYNVFRTYFDRLKGFLKISLSDKDYKYVHIKDESVISIHWKDSATTT